LGMATMAVMIMDTEGREMGNGVRKGAGHQEVPLLGAYYYNWYNLDDQWSHHPRTHEPELGAYDLSDRSTMQKHHEWARQSNIDFFIMPWSGVGEGEQAPERDVEIDRRVEEHLTMKQGVKVALMYTAFDILGDASENDLDLSVRKNCDRLKDHWEYAAKHYFSKDNYLRIHGSPVLYVYGFRWYRNFQACMQEAQSRILSATSHKLYLVVDTIWWYPAPEQADWKGMQAINVSGIAGYNLYDAAQPSKMGLSFAWEAAQLLHDFVSLAWDHGMMVVPTVMPGYDDRRRGGSGRPTVPRARGAELAHQWKQLLWFSVCQPKILRAGAEKKEKYPSLVLVNSFNQWHDGTEVEPSQHYGDQYLKLIRALKSEVVKEEVPCGKEKDATFKTPTYFIPSMRETGGRTPGDKAFIQGLLVVGTLFLSWSMLMACGKTILLYTGKAPSKFKDDDQSGEEQRHFNEVAAGYLGEGGGRGRRRYPKRSPSTLSWVVVGAIFVFNFCFIYYVFHFSPVSEYFDARHVEYRKAIHDNLRAAREVAHRMCPTLSLSLHQKKFEMWVLKLASNQISRAEFHQEMCGDRPYHRREVEALVLELCGREATAEETSRYEKELEEGNKTLDEIRQEISETSEAQEFAQLKQQNHVRQPRSQLKS